MALPIPHLDEQHSAFLSRCSDSLVDLEDVETRASVCERQWAKKRMKQHRFSLLLSPILSSEEFTTDTGIPAETFRKDILHIGTFADFEITPKVFDKMLANFRKWERKGLAVPLVSHHDAKDNPKDFLGYLTDLEVDGDRLIGTFTVRGAAALETVKRINQVSIEFFERGYVDQFGEEYSNVLTRVALTPTPVIAKQQGFKGQYSMLNQKELSRIARLLGEDCTGEDAFDKLEAKFSNQTTEDYQAKYELSLKQIKQLESQVVPAAPVEVVEQWVQIAEQKLSRLVNDAQIPSGVADKIRGHFFGTESERNVKYLSARGKETPEVIRLLEILAELPQMVSFGQKTRSQTRVLSDGNRGKNEDDVNPETFNAMLKMAGVR